MPVIDVHTCDQYGRVSLTGCLQVLTFYVSESVAAMAVWPYMVVGWFEVIFSRGLGFSPARLSEKVQYTTILPMRAMYDDLMFWHPVPPNEPVCGPHQSDDNPILDASARLRVGLPPRCCEAAG